MDAATEMNRIYRYQRYFYDVTRKSFLLGRDTLLRRMRIRPGDRVLEVGCGTARNLLKLEARHRDVELFGLDASTEMLETARKKLAHRRTPPRLHLQHGLAQELCHERTFGGPRFDVIFFSYSLSMIPDATQSIAAAYASLKPSGALYIVDFCDQAELPSLLRDPFQSWLGLFGVKHRPELYQYLQALAADGKGMLELESFGLRYGIIAEFRKTAAS